MKGRREERNAEAVQQELQHLDREIEELRGANFHDLVNADKFTLSVPVPGERDADNEVDKPASKDEEPDGKRSVTFGELVNRILKSDLARDLVRHRYIDRNFTLYAAQFYGDFSGVDVATFIVQTVQTNSMAVNYPFTSPNAFANLLAETDEDFTRTISAYNIQLVDHLLVEDVERADEVVKHLTSHFGSEAEEFLAAFFTSNGQRLQLAARLSSQGWRDVFTYLVANEGVPTDVRPALVDAALVAADLDGVYDLRDTVGDFVMAHYKEMPAFTEPHPRSDLDTVVTMLQRAGVLLPSLDGMHHEMRMLIVDNNLYELTAENLRIALDITGEVTLDRLRDNDTVYQYCMSHLGAYLDAVETDDHTVYAARTVRTLIDALEAAERDDKTLERLTTTASPETSLWRLTDALEPSWPALARSKLFRASLTNLEAYRAQVGDIDESLGGLLLSEGVIHTDDGDTEEHRDEEDTNAPDKAAAAVAILNAGAASRTPRAASSSCRASGSTSRSRSRRSQPRTAPCSHSSSSTSWFPTTQPPSPTSVRPGGPPLGLPLSPRPASRNSSPPTCSTG